MLRVMKSRVTIFTIHFLIPLSRAIFSYRKFIGTDDILVSTLFNRYLIHSRLMIFLEHLDRITNLFRVVIELDIYIYVSFAGDVTSDILQRTVYTGDIQKVGERKAGSWTPRENGRLRGRLPGERPGAGHRGPVQRLVTLSARPFVVHELLPEMEVRTRLFQPTYKTV